MSFQFETFSDSLPNNQDQMQQLQFELSNLEQKICMLQEEVVTLTADNDQLQKEKEQWVIPETPSAKTSRPPLAENNTTMNLMDDTLNGTYTDGFIDDSVKKNQLLNPSRLDKKLNGYDNKENQARPPKGEMTIQIESLEKEVEIEELKNEIDDLRTLTSEFQENAQSLEVQAQTVAADLEAAKKSSHSKNETIKELEIEVEDCKAELNRANKKAADYEAMKSKCQDMEIRTAAMEVDYVKKKDEFNQGKNLFAEVEERRHCVEKAAVGLKEDLLKFRQERNQLQVAYDKKCLENKKLQVLVTENRLVSGSDQGGDAVDNREYRNMGKRYDAICDDHRQLKTKVSDFQEQARGALAEDLHRNDEKLALEKMIAVNRKYDNLLENQQNLMKENTKLNYENENLSYKYKVLDHYNNLPDDHKYLHSRDQAVQTEDDKEKAGAGECNQQ